MKNEILMAMAWGRVSAVGLGWPVEDGETINDLMDRIGEKAFLTALRGLSVEDKAELWDRFTDLLRAE